MKFPPVSDWQYYRFQLRSAKSSRIVDVLAPDATSARIGAGPTSDEVVVQVDISRFEAELKKTFTKKEVSVHQLTEFWVTISQIIETDGTFSDAFELASSSAKSPYFRGVIGSMRNYILQGRTANVHEVFELHPSVFGVVECNIVAASANSAEPGKLLRMVSTMLQKRASRANAIRKALLQPTITIILGSIVSLAITVFILPRIAKAFLGLGNKKLPVITEVLMHFGDFVRTQPWVILVAIAVIGVLFSKRNQIANARLVQEVALKLPKVGPMLMKAGLSRAMYVLALLTVARIKTDQAFDLVSKVGGNKIILDYFSAVASSIRSGRVRALDEAFLAERHRIGDEGLTIASQARIGMKSGKGDELYQILANRLEQEADAASDVCVAMLGPAAMFIVMGMVVTVAMATYLPVFSMSDALMKAKH